MDFDELETAWARALRDRELPPGLVNDVVTAAGGLGPARHSEWGRACGLLALNAAKVAACLMLLAI